MNQHSEPEIKRILQVYGDMLYRTAYLLLGNSHDVQDVRLCPDPVYGKGACLCIQRS